MEGSASTPIPTFSIRPATEDDLSKIVEIESRAHTSVPWTEDHFRKELAKPYSRFLLLTDDETDETIAAYIIYWVIAEGAEVLNVVVDLEYRRRGMAKQLIRHAVDEALKAGLEKLSLDVRTSNSAAIQLYQNLGFSVTSVRKAFYSNKEDAYHMTLLLTGERIEF